jgi:hypothetical protein
MIMSAQDHDLGFVYRFVPARDDSRKPLLLLHGTGGDESDLIALGERLSPAAALLSPRGKVLEGGMPRFFRGSPRAVGPGGFLGRSAELAQFVAAARKKYALPPRSRSVFPMARISPGRCCCAIRIARRRDPDARDAAVRSRPCPISTACRC